MSKDLFFVYSVFSEDLQDYPYYPFIAKNHSSALSKFINFIQYRETVCRGATLHCIGRCKVDNEGVIIDGSLQPFVVPFEVQFKGNLVSKLLVLGYIYREKLANYLKNITENQRKELPHGKSK